MGKETVKLELVLELNPKSTLRIVTNVVALTNSRSTVWSAVDLMLSRFRNCERLLLDIGAVLCYAIHVFSCIPDPTKLCNPFRSCQAVSIRRQSGLSWGAVLCCVNVDQRSLCHHPLLPPSPSNSSPTMILVATFMLVSSACSKRNA